MRIAWAIIAVLNRARCPGRTGGDRRGMLAAPCLLQLTVWPLNTVAHVRWRGLII